MAIATRTRSKGLQESSNEKEFESFLNQMITSVKDDDTSSASSTTSSSSSSSSYYWSAESPDSVVPGSTSSDDTSTVTVCTDDYVSDNNVSVQGSSDGNIVSLPGLTQRVDTDLKVSISSAFP